MNEKIKINHMILSIPPFISTTWDEVASLFLDKEGLIILLKNNLKVRIPIPDDTLLQMVFDAHKKYLENQLAPQRSKEFIEGMPTAGLSFKLGKLDDMDMLGQAMQHNPNQADAADIPEDILHKITKIAGALGLSDQENLPQAEPHCNCMHCQLARAIRGEIRAAQDELISDEDLTFRDWEIEQKSDYVYVVTNPLDVSETYNVFLGNPLGCTCGKKNCEHIRTVLNS